jgi:hypothetical protein
VKEFTIRCLAHFVDLKVVALENGLSFELAIEKGYTSICYWHQVRTLLQ